MTIIHCCVDVRGMLKNGRKRELALMFRDADGRRLTADEAKDVLMDHLAAGHEVIPFGPCDNFDFKTGCKGHPSPGASHG